MLQDPERQRRRTREERRDRLSGYQGRRTPSPAPSSGAAAIRGPPNQSNRFSPTLLSDFQRRALQGLRGAGIPPRNPEAGAEEEVEEVEEQEGEILNESFGFEIQGEEAVPQGDHNITNMPLNLEDMAAELDTLRRELQTAQQNDHMLRGEIQGLQDRLAHVADDAQRNRGDAANGRPGILRPDTFGQKDQESWPNFRRRFEHCAAFNGWSESQMKLALVNAMVGKAADAVRDINVNDHLTVQDMLVAYEQRFLPKAESDIVRIQFDRCRQGARESVLEFHSRLRALFRRAYPNAADDVQLIRRFAFGLANPFVQQMVLRKQPDTYVEALDAALNESAVLDVTDAIRTGSSSLTNPLPSTNQLQNISGQDTRSEPMEIGAIGSNDCMFCGKPGHWKSKCQLWAKARRLLLRRGGQGRGAAGSGRNPASGQNGNRPATRGRGGFANSRGRGRGTNPSRDPERARSMFRQMIAALQEGDLEDGETWDEEDDGLEPVAALEVSGEDRGAADGETLDEVVAALTDAEIDELFGSGFA